MPDSTGTRKFGWYLLVAIIVTGFVGLVAYLVSNEMNYAFLTVFVPLISVASLISRYALATLGNGGSDAPESTFGDEVDGNQVNARTSAGDVIGGDRVEGDYVHVERVVSDVSNLFENETDDVTEARYVHPRLQNMSATDFEEFISALFEKQGWEVERADTDQDRGIDMTASQMSGLVAHEIGVCLKQYPEEMKVDTVHVRRLAGQMVELGLDVLLLITTSSLTEPASAEAEKVGIQFVDGAALETFIHENETYELFEQFAPSLRNATRSGKIPAQEVPQAGSFELIDEVLRTVESGNRREPDIVAAMEDVSGTLHPRQANYYTMAAHLLGFLQPADSDTDDRFMSWNLTKRGETYLAYRRGNDEKADEQLRAAIGSVEIVKRVESELQKRGRLDQQAVAQTLEKESELGRATAERRATTVARWLANRPDVRKEGSVITQSG